MKVEDGRQLEGREDTTGATGEEGKQTLVLAEAKICRALRNACGPGGPTLLS